MKFELEPVVPGVTAAGTPAEKVIGLSLLPVVEQVGVVIREPETKFVGV
ncbi:unnamed protein product [marine sediment metagenome]|uniref:Uncharacterized protein n=1 Tax=marine sediment metagenome TaxID=412755 RepID=X1TRD8_9ZZZZ